MRKINLILYTLFVFMNWCSLSYAQDSGGKIILDLKDDNEYNYDDSQFWPNIMRTGYNYINDVKQYNEQLDGNNIEKDFTDDITAKYPSYTKEGAGIWQKYIRKGVKTVRFFDNIKNQIKQWILDYQLPIVADDNQYEMGEKEEYIESDTPIVRTNFKKIIAYSKSDKDQLAIQEKYAKEHNMTRPSQLITWYRENIIQGKWKKIWHKIWHNVDSVDENDNEDKTKEDDDKKRIAERLKPSYSIIMKKNGFGDDGKFEGVVNIIPPTNQIILLKTYKDYTGLQIDFDRSENIKDVSIHFMPPQDMNTKDGYQVLFYGSEFAVYFQGTVQDINKEVVLRLNGFATACQNDRCERHHNFLETKLIHKENPENTKYDYYVNIAKMNTPHNSSKEAFKIDGLFSEIRQNKQKGMRLDFSADDGAYTKILLIGKNADYFAAPQISLKNGKTEAWFKLLKNDFDYEGQDFTFWLIDKSGRQYLATEKVEMPSVFDQDSSSFTISVLFFAILGGLLLNFMPCVFPVLSLKLLAFTKFGGLKKSNIRSNFMCNSLGILTAFLMMALLISSLKMLGISMGWGIQFQSITFLAVMIWVITYFMAYIMGIVGLAEQKLVEKAAQTTPKNKLIFEFMSGVFMVVLSTPCTAPYLGTALGIALAGSPWQIIITVTAIGLGLALPYIMIAVFPQIAFYMPRPGKWLKIINLAMILMLIITMLWLISLLSSQIGGGQLWHWSLYIIVALLMWTYFHYLQMEIDKLAKGETKVILQKRCAKWKLLLRIVLVVISLIDVRWQISKRNVATSQTTVWAMTMNTINEYVDDGYKVLVKIGADWCLTCKYNDKFILNSEFIQDSIKSNNVIVMDVDWANYNEQVLQFMQKFGRQGLPFYVLFSQKFKDGIVLPEILDKYEFNNLINM